MSIEEAEKSILKVKSWVKLPDGGYIPLIFKKYEFESVGEAVGYRFDLLKQYEKNNNGVAKMVVHTEIFLTERKIKLKKCILENNVNHRFRYFEKFICNK